MLDTSSFSIWDQFVTKCTVTVYLVPYLFMVYCYHVAITQPKHSFGVCGALNEVLWNFVLQLTFLIFLSFRRNQINIYNYFAQDQGVWHFNICSVPDTTNSFKKHCTSRSQSLSRSFTILKDIFSYF